MSMFKKCIATVLFGCSAVLSTVATAAGGLVSLGGSVTEIIYALGEGEQLIATDYSSLYPAEATKLTQVGYYRSIGVEGVASTMPTMVIASENAGPKEALQRLDALGIPVHTVSDKGTLDSLYERIQQVASVLQVPQEGERIQQAVKQQVEEALKLPAKSRRAAMVINRTGTLQAAGHSTSADELMRISGFSNIFADQQSYKPISKESFVSLQPDVIITTTGSVEASGGLAKFLSDAGITNTPAELNNKVVVLDDLLALGMGPRVAEAIKQLRSIP